MDTKRKIFWPLATILLVSLALLVTTSEAQATADWLWHNYNTEPSVPSPSSSTEVWVKIGYHFYTNQARIYYTTDGTSPQGSYDTVSNGTKVTMTFDHTEWDAGAGKYVDWWKGTIPAQSAGTIVKYKIAAWHSDGGDIVFADNNVNTSQAATEFAYESNTFTTPQWAKDAVIYEIFIDRFYDGDPNNNYDYTGQLDGYMGGDLQGVIDKLPYLDDLGVTVLWLTPIYEGPEYHGFRITDFEDVENNFGTLTTLSSLVTAAHNRGIKVIIDLVPNHSSDTHSFFVDASTNCTNSTYYNWYTFYNCPPSVPDDYATFFGVGTLPKLNNENTAARNYTIGLGDDWIEFYDVDGYRLDYALGLSHNYWVDFRRAIKARDSNAFLIGEAWEEPAVMKMYEGELDGVLDFTLIYSFRDFFATRTKNVDQFDSDLNTYENYYHSEFLMGKFLDNHDMNRFLWVAGNDKSRLKLAAVAQFTLQDPPVIYQGDEVGQSQEQDISQGDKYVRAPMLWGQDQDTDVLNHYKRLIDIRNTYPALRTGTRTTLYRHNTDSTYAFRREDTNDKLLVVFNNSDSTHNVTMPNLSGVSLGISDGTVMVDLLGGDTYTVSSGQIGLDLPAMTGAILVARKTSDVPVTFTVNGYVTQFGEDIYVVGSVPELGYWDPDKAVPLTWVDSDTWSGDVLFTDFTKGDGIEYKYIVKSGGQVTWEADPNHSYTVPSTGTGSATDNWQQ